MKQFRDRHFVLLLFAGITALSAFPFYPLRSPAEMGSMISDFFAFTIEPPILRTVLERIILLVPLGFFLGRGLRGVALWRQIVAMLFGALALCLFLEAVQVPIAGRHARSSDALLAVVCVTAGYVLAARIYGEPRARVRILAYLSAAWPCALAAMIWAIGPSTINWSSDYPIALGDEWDGGRSWAGEVSGIAIYPEGLSADDVARVSAAPFDPAHAGIRMQLGALWVFSGDDSTGAARAPLRFPGPKVPPDARLPSNLGQRLAAATRASEGLTVEVRLRSASLHQYGPARIVTNSPSRYLRNFALAQDRDEFVFRMRTLSSGANGEVFSLYTHGDKVNGDWQHVVATYKDGRAIIYVDGVRAIGPYAFNRPMRWDHQLYAPTLVVISALGIAGAMLLSTFWPTPSGGRRHRSLGRRIDTLSRYTVRRAIRSISLNTKAKG